MNCYLCKKSNLEVIRKKLRYNIQRNVLRCKDCGLVYLEPKKEDISEYYNKIYRKFHSPVLGKVSSPEEIFNISLPFQNQNIAQIEHILNPEMKVLDIGCSAGHFLYSLKKYVKECFGVELNKEHAEFAKKKAGIKVFTEPLENINFSPNSFDLISAIDLIEHLEDPINFFKVVNKYLKPDGYLYVKTPNLMNALISIYQSKPFSDFWFREPHIYYFSPKTLSAVLEKSGFKGNIKITQEYNFINQMNWFLAGKPQKSADIGMSQPELITSNFVNEDIKRDFNSWVQRIDKEYSGLLNKYKIGDTLLFLGKKLD